MIYSNEEAYTHSLLEPNDVIRYGNQKRYKPLFKQVGDMLDNMTPDERAAMAELPTTEKQKDLFAEKIEKELGL